MLGALKRIFGKAPVVSPVAGTVPSAPTTVAAEPARPSNQTGGTTIQPTPARREATTHWRRAAKPDEVAVSFRAIFHQLPSDLRGRLGSASAGHTAFFLPRSQALEQLAQGAIKVPFGHLRRAAPLGLFVNTNDHDNRLIPLPLQEILPQLPPEAFSRRPDQRPWQEPEGIPALFGPKGQQRTAVRVVPKTELKQTPAASDTTTVKPPAAAAVPPGPAPSPASALAASAPKAVSPTPAPVQRLAAQAPPSAPNKIGRSGLATAVAPAPASPHGATVAGPPSRTAAEPPAEVLLVPVRELAAGWPESVQQELKRLGCVQAQCALPINEITEPLKAGRIQVPLRRLLSWVSPQPSQPCLTQVAEVVVELPLQSVVPRYFARCKLAPKSKKTVPSDSVPDLFTKDGRLAKPPQTRPAPPPAAGPQRSPEANQASAEPQATTLVLPLRDLSGQWPEPVQRELAQFNLQDAQVHLPLEVAEKHLRQGKIDFAWKELCAWLKDCPQSVPSPPTAELRVELPLPVVAPRFIKLRPPPAGPAAAEVAPDIPDLFGPGKALPRLSTHAEAAGQAASAPSTTGAAARRPSKPPAVTAPAAPQPAKKPPKDIAELFGEPDKRVWTPNELVHKTACLPGVDGALIALQDGLLVAHCMPPNWKTETIAAFLPQMFGRMNQYARELGMGELRSLTFSVEGGALQIFAAGIIYFAALGKTGACLPQPELDLIATELSRHTK